MSYLLRTSHIFWVWGPPGSYARRPSHFGSRATTAYYYYYYYYHYHYYYYYYHYHYYHYRYHYLLLLLLLLIRIIMIMIIISITIHISLIQTSLNRATLAHAPGSARRLRPDSWLPARGRSLRGRRSLEALGYQLYTSCYELIICNIYVNT